MDCRNSVLAAFTLALGAGCVTTQPITQGGASDPPANAIVQKASDGPKRPPLPGTVVAMAVIKEREAGNPANDAAQQIKLYDEARQYFQEALKIDPKYRDAVQGLARVYGLMADYPHALQIYRTALAKTPKDHGLWFDLGMCYSHQKDLVQALPCFQKALELDPENRRYMKQLGFTLARAGQTDQSLALLTKAVGTAMAHYNLARMMDHMGQPDQCRNHLQLALQINPNLDQAREMLDSLQTTPRATIQFAE